MSRECGGLMSEGVEGRKRWEANHRLQSISEHAMASKPDVDKQQPQQQSGVSCRRSHMVRKALRYFEDKSNRSVSEDNLFTRRKNLTVHLGLDEKVSKREVQKIATFCLPVPSSSLDMPDTSMASGMLVVMEEMEETREAEDRPDADEELLRTKNLVSFLGMKDGLTASIASQGTLSEDSSNKEVSLTASPSSEENSCVKVAALMSCARITTDTKSFDTASKTDEKANSQCHLGPSNLDNSK